MHLKNILFISIIISICLGLGFIIDNPIVINAIILIFIIHWISFIPANIYKTEKFFDLTGSLTYISVVSYVCLFLPGSWPSLCEHVHQRKNTSARCMFPANRLPMRAPGHTCSTRGCDLSPSYKTYVTG